MKRIIAATLITVLALLPGQIERGFDQNFVKLEAKKEIKSKEQTSKTQNSTKKKNSKTKKTYKIVIDAGHQKKGNPELEPIGPGAKTKKAKVSSGTQGRETKIPEYEVNLAVALKLKDILVERGYEVVMIRETNEVNISNAERAEIANQENADAFLRIHCNGSEDRSVQGALTMCSTKKNKYCKEYYKKSKQLSECVLDGLCEETGAKKRSRIETDTMSGINWCKVPVTIIEMGYLTNKKEEKRLVEPEYQEKLAKGIADGLDEYFNQSE